MGPGVPAIAIAANVVQHPRHDPIVTTWSRCSIIPYPSMRISMLPDIANRGIERVICELVCGKWRIAIRILGTEQVTSPSHVRVEGTDGFALDLG